MHTVIGAFVAGLFLRNVKNVDRVIHPFYAVLVPMNNLLYITVYHSFFVIILAFEYLLLYL